VFGGRNPSSYCNDTYIYDFVTNTWTNAQANNPPPVRAYHAMAFDKVHGKILLFGGATDSTSYGDTWAYDYATNSWTNMNPGSSPQPLSGHTMAFDSMNQRIILFGGSDNNNKDSNVTWAYSFEENTWKDLHATNPPTARHYHGMVFDENQQKAIVYGGTFGQGDLSDTWAYDPNSNSWSERKPNGSPGPTSHILGGMAYDSKNSRTVLFGGWGGVDSTAYEGTYQAQPKSSTWIYDYASNSWTTLKTDKSPSARYFHCLSFDSTRGLVWLVGGGSNFVTSKDTWSLSLP
jgi:N-acetylneuraminic acid mutarotase